MTSVIRDPMFDLTLARWECVGSCSCDDRRADRVYEERRKQYPTIERKPFDPEIVTEASVGYWRHLLDALLGRKP